MASLSSRGDTTPQIRRHAHVAAGGTGAHRVGWRLFTSATTAPVLQAHADGAHDEVRHGAVRGPNCVVPALCDHETGDRGGLAVVIRPTSLEVANRERERALFRSPPTQPNVLKAIELRSWTFALLGKPPRASHREGCWPGGDRMARTEGRLGAPASARGMCPRVCGRSLRGQRPRGRRARPRPSRGEASEAARGPVTWGSSSVAFRSRTDECGRHRRRRPMLEGALSQATTPWVLCKTDRARCRLPRRDRA